MMFPGAWVLNLPGTIYYQAECHQDIYGLVDPRSQTIHYIGRSRNAKTRLREHLRPGNHLFGNGRAKLVWLDELASLGLQPTLRILETIEPFKLTGKYYKSLSGWRIHDTDCYGEIRRVREYSSSMVRYQAYVNEREQRWIYYGIQQGWPLTNGDVQLLDGGAFTQAFAQWLCQHSNFDILHEPLHSPAWNELVTICPHTALENQRGSHDGYPLAGR